MELLEYRDEPRLSTAEIIASAQSVIGVRKFEYNPVTGFMHAEISRELCQPYTIVEKIESCGISADGLFLFYPESPLAQYTQHVRYNAKTKAFNHSSGSDVDAAKIEMAA